MTDTPLTIFVKPHRHLGGGQTQSCSLQDHLASILPGLRPKIDFLQSGTRKSAHPAMNIRVVAPIDAIENPSRQRCAEVPVQSWHRPLLDAASQAAAHDKLRSFSKLLNERSQFPKVVGQVRVAHHDPFSADIRNGIDVRPAKPTLRRAEDLAAMPKNNLGRIIVGAVDNENLTVHAGALQALLAPLNEFAHGNLLIQSRDDDA